MLDTLNIGHPIIKPSENIAVFNRGGGKTFAQELIFTFENWLDETFEEQL